MTLEAVLRGAQRHLKWSMITEVAILFYRKLATAKMNDIASVKEGWLREPRISDPDYVHQSTVFIGVKDKQCRRNWSRRDSNLKAV